MLIAHLFVNYAHVNLCHFFSSTWYQWLGAISARGSSGTFHFTLFLGGSSYILCHRVKDE